MASYRSESRYDKYSIIFADAQLWIYSVTAKAVRSVLYVFGGLIMLSVIYLLYRLLVHYCSPQPKPKFVDAFEGSDKVSEKSEYSV